VSRFGWLVFWAVWITMLVVLWGMLGCSTETPC
jgi:hypothetical protein